MSKPSIAIIPGSTRDGRFADQPLQWIKRLADSRPDLQARIVDLREFPLPFFEEAGPPAMAAPKNEVARTWAQTLAGFDGFIFVTPEYNHGIPGVLKNALDYAYAEWNLKPAAFVGYGAMGAARAVQNLRLTVAALRMAPIARAVHLGMTEFQGIRGGKASFSDFPHLDHAAGAMLDELSWWTSALKAAREKA